jgi:hypothetical protein
MNQERKKREEEEKRMWNNFWVSFLSFSLVCQSSKEFSQILFCSSEIILQGFELLFSLSLSKAAASVCRIKGLKLGFEALKLVENKVIV